MKPKRVIEFIVEWFIFFILLKIVLGYYLVQADPNQGLWLPWGIPALATACTLWIFSAKWGIWDELGGHTGGNPASKVYFILICVCLIALVVLFLSGLFSQTVQIFKMVFGR